jgi:calcineurin-like phosphoesterase family protein
MSTFFTSDTHFGHTNIIKYCIRPFLFDPSKGFDDPRNRDVDFMDETLIKNWNSVVQPNDTVYHLGDFAFYRDQRKTRNVLRRLNGNKILIRGNHDEYLEPETLQMFGSVHYYHEISVPDKDVGKQKIVLLHYGMRVWNKSHRGSWQLYGHSHGTLPDDPSSLSFDVGTDCHGYTPISYEQVKKIMAKKTFKPIDHHGE